MSAIRAEEYSLVSSVIILAAEIVLGSTGNVIICYAVYKNKSLRTPINALVLNVSVCGIVEALVSTPLLLIILLAGGYLHDAAFIAQKFIHILCGSVQLISIIAISYERHQAIARPFDKLQRVKRARISIPLSWIIGLLSGFIATFVFSGYLVHNLVQHDSEMIVLESFEAVILVPLSLASALTVACLYVIIVYLVHKHINQKNTKFKMSKSKVAPAAQSTVLVDFPQTSGTGKEFLRVPSRTHVNHSDLKLTEISTVNSNNCNNDTDTAKIRQGKSALDAVTHDPLHGTPGTVAQSTIAQSTAAHSTVAPSTVAPSTVAQNTTSQSTVAQSTIAQGTVVTRHVVDVYAMDGTKTQESTSNELVSGAICVMNPANKERGKRRVEAKTAKVTAIVIGGFLICWTPYPVSVLVVYLSREHINTKLNIYMICLSLSVIAASLNPVIYGLINKGIRTEVTKQYNKLKAAARQRFSKGNKS